MNYLTKKCIVCNKTIHRASNVSDFMWKKKKYCSVGDCGYLQSCINVIEKKGFKVIKPKTTLAIPYDTV